MADIADVESALVSLIAQTLYPSGIGQPSATVGTIPCKVYAGWPAESQLDADLLAGITNITVYPTATERNTTRFTTDWQQISINEATISLSENGQLITVGGAMPSPFVAHNVMAFINGKNYAYAVQPNDSLTTIATALAALLAVDYPGTANIGPVITVESGGRIGTVRVGTDGIMQREVRRQERVFQITVWSDTPSNRKAVVDAIDPMLSITSRLTLIDQSYAHMVYKSSMDNDMMQKAKLYRRDLFYSVEYGTTQITSAHQVTQETLNIDMTPQGIDTPVGEISFNL